MSKQRKWQLRAVVGVLLAATTLWAGDRAAISTSRLQQDVNFLAAPELKGRGTGTRELHRAAEYIAKQFLQAGLEPAVAGSYFQPFQVTVGAELTQNNHAKVKEGEAEKELRLEKDYVPLNFSDSGGGEMGLVFGGYGISAPEFQYDDYFHLDVRDKAVVVLRGEPETEKQQAVFDGKQLTQHASIVSKAINARNHGARAMVLVNATPSASEEDLLIRFGSLTGPENAGLLLIQAKREAAEKWLAGTGKTLAELQKEIEEKMAPQSFPVSGVKLTLEVGIKRLTAETQNVAGIVRGSDPKLAGEAIVIGAHYDHLGLGDKGNSLAPSMVGQVHPGADDNASGTAAVLELARVLSERRKEVKRSVVFLTFSGEEMGLLGSAYYTKNPVWPLERTVAMINLDMVGRLREKRLYVSGLGTSPVMKEILEKANTSGLEISPSESGYGSSDHQSFYVQDVPVLFLFSGLHADYHKPSDTADKIDTAGLARVTDLAMNAAEELANLEERPQFVRVQEPRRPVVGGSGPGYGAYFGSVPDMGSEVKGVRFADVRDGSPAGKAGLKGGDILVEFDGKEIQNLYDFTYALQSHRPGQEVEVTVVREGKPLKVKVTLEQRK